ncbi:MAG: hypothetical protein ACYC4U_10315 [Pirellulaceae bacterium]
MLADRQSLQRALGEVANGYRQQEPADHRSIARVHDILSAPCLPQLWGSHVDAAMPNLLRVVRGELTLDDVLGLPGDDSVPLVDVADGAVAGAEVLLRDAADAMGRWWLPEHTVNG